MLAAIERLGRGETLPEQLGHAIRLRLRRGLTLPEPAYSRDGR